jgi:hypothetical protein
MENQWLHFDEKDAKTHPYDGAKIEIQLFNGRVFGAAYVGGTIVSVGHVNSGTAIPEEFTTENMHWRYEQ